MVTKTVGDLYRGAPYVTRTLVVLVALVSGLIGVVIIFSDLITFPYFKSQAGLVVLSCIGSVFFWFPVALALAGRAGRVDSE